MSWSDYQDSLQLLSCSDMASMFGVLRHSVAGPMIWNIHVHYIVLSGINIDNFEPSDLFEYY